jgi:hypothetical protein
MRALKILTAVMGVLIIVGVVVIGVTIMRRLNGPGAPAPTASAMPAQPALPTTLDEPVGTSIAQVSADGDRVVLLLHGGGPDRVVVVDARSGVVLGRTALTH